MYMYQNRSSYVVYENFTPHNDMQGAACTACQQATHMMTYRHANNNPMVCMSVQFTYMYVLYKLPQNLTNFSAACAQQHLILFCTTVQGLSLQLRKAMNDHKKFMPK